jgi:hypothetical protein
MQQINALNDTYLHLSSCRPNQDVNRIDLMRGSSTQQAADKIGISKRQLLRWIYDAKIPEVRRVQLGGIEVRVWMSADIQRARRFKECSSVTRVSREA